MLTHSSHRQFLVRLGAGLVIAFVLHATIARAQDSDSKPAKPEPEQVQTFFLKNVTQMNDLNDIQTDLRNVLYKAKIYGVASQYAITVRGTAEDLQTAQKLVAELDHPRKTYRVTFTITESDGAQKTGTHH